MRVATVTYNPGEKIRRWVEEWKPLVPSLIVIDQSSTDGSTDWLEYEPGVLFWRNPHMGVAEPDFNMAIDWTGSGEWLLHVGDDEFMQRKHIKVCDKLCKQADEMAINALWIRRVNLVDGVDCSEIDGEDWQLRLTKGPAIRYSITAHQHPEMHPDIRFALVHKDAAWIEHRRTLKGLIAANEARNPYISQRAQQMQRDYINRVTAIVKGAKYGEEE